jgi:glycosyltransferase involved in cell wall biosynthesis/peptidoglycan/xylan/chitin deacetylase (PgdA/CDA1 family)
MQSAEPRTTRRPAKVNRRRGAGPLYDLSFSIVVPTYQRREVVCDAVRAIAQLDYSGSIELIVVVDGSSDGTAAALAQLECPFPFQIIDQANAGASNARNRGAAEASNDILLFLDDDMMCEADLVEQHARMYQEGADAVIGNTPTHPDSAPGFLSESVRRWVENEQVRSPLSHWDVFSGQLSVRRSVFDAVGGFDESYTTGAAFSNEDADLGVRLLSRFDVRHNPSAITHQRYVVCPREFMDRASKAAEGDLYFMSRHPQFAGELLEAKGVTKPLTRFVYLPLSRIPLVPRILSAVAVSLAEVGLKTPFRSNRLLGRFFSGARAVAYWSAFRDRAGMSASQSLLVLSYHAIEDQSADPILAPYGVSPELFVEHLDFLSSAGFSFIAPDSFANFLQYGTPLPKRPVLLTFDDCYEDLLQVARDILQPRKIQAIAFAVTGMESGTNEWDQAYGAGRLRLLNGAQLHELAALGVEIGSHSRSHREMPLLGRPEQEEEASGSANDLATLGLPRPRFFAYPFGAVDEGSTRAVREAGYIAAFGCGADYMTQNSNRFNLPRVAIYAYDRGWRFRMKATAPRLVLKLAWLQQGVKARLGRIGSLVSGRS